MQKTAPSLSSILRMLFLVVGYPIALVAMVFHTFIHGGIKPTKKQEREQLSKLLKKLSQELEK